MAKTRLSNATYVERGYGQVEPNHLSAQRNGQVYAQLPAKSDIDMLENGQFVKYDYAAGVVDFTGAGDWMLVYNEVKVYREGEGDADFAMIKGNYAAQVYDDYGHAMPTGTSMVPRLFKTNVGDIMTTNTITGTDATIVAGAMLAPAAANGILAVVASGDQAAAPMLWQVVKVYTMPDGQKGAKIMRIK